MFGASSGGSVKVEENVPKRLENLYVIINNNITYNYSEKENAAPGRAARVVGRAAENLCYRHVFANKYFQGRHGGRAKYILYLIFYRVYLDFTFPVIQGLVYTF